MMSSMPSNLTKPAAIGVSAVVVSSTARWLNGSSGSLDTNDMLTLAGVGAASAYVAPTVTSAVYNGTGKGVVEAVVSGALAAGMLYAWSGDSSVVMHIPVQALAHIGGSVVVSSASAPSRAQQQAMAPPVSAESVADLAAAIA
jgi:hypothetical protein